MNKILIIDDAHPVLLESFETEDVHYLPNINTEQLALEIVDTDVLIVRSKLHLNQTWLKKAKKLKLIGRLGSGMDNIDVNYANKKGIVCLNAAEGNRDAVAEQCIAMMISIIANVHKSALEMRAGQWNRTKNSGRELSTMTVGIIGYGNVGQALAKRLSVFGCKVIAYDKYKEITSEFAEAVSLAQLQDEADIVSLHVPLNNSTLNMINDSFIQRMKRPFYLLNLARGEVVNSTALVSALESGKILGAGLDVFENENINTLTDLQQHNFDFLRYHPKVIFTPHIAGLTAESYFKLSVVLAKKIKDILK